MKRVMTLALVGVLAAAGCGGSSKSSSSTGTVSSSGGGGGTQLTLTADPNQLKFDQSQLAAKAGKVTITMTNPSPLQHDVSIKGGVDAHGNVVSQGGKSVVTADLKSGQYTFYCSVDGHEAAGMTGTLTVS
jgi:plastocyanin